MVAGGGVAGGGPTLPSGGLMRCVVVGSDEDGRSHIVREQEIDAEGRTVLWETTSGDAPSFPRQEAGLSDLHVPPGNVRWVMRFQPPEHQSPMHWTETVDFDLIVTGKIDLLLDTGAVRLSAGDCVVLAGARHAWRTDPDGCLMMLAIHGESAH
jgi:hypothetical protein